MKKIGIDIGGTFVKWVILSESEEVEKFGKFSTFNNLEKNANVMLDNIVDFFSDEKFKYIEKIGVSTAGIIDHDGTVIFAGNIPDYQGMNVVKEIESRLNKKVRVENDVNCAALAEFKKDNSVTISIGTGIGGGIVVNGKLYKGFKGWAGEFGHINIRDNSTLEELASASSLMNKLSNVIPELQRGEDIVKYRGNNEIETIINRWQKDIAIGIKNVVLSNNPEEVILGGGIVSSDAFNLQLIEKHLSKIMPGNIKVDGLLRVAEKGNEASAIGAAKLW